MSEYRRSSHVVFRLRYHFVFITKYRKPVLRGDIAREVRVLVREVCRSHDIEIVSGHIRPEHVHLLLDIPPKWSPSRVMQAIKGKTSHHLLEDYRRLRKELRGRHLWARGRVVPVRYVAGLEPRDIAEDGWGARRGLQGLGLKPRGTGGGCVSRWK